MQKWSPISWVILLFALLLSACQLGVEKRPYGYMHLGKIRELLASETYLKDIGLFLRRDSQGFSIMSTYCTYDLAPLVPREGSNGFTWVSPFTESTYSKDGKVLTAPAKEDLPYYQLEFAAGEYGGPVDSLYVKVGSEVPKTWRLNAPGLAELPDPAAASLPDSQGPVASPVAD